MQKPKKAPKKVPDNSKNASSNSSREHDDTICQYEYMMRVSQPDVPCPDADTILSMLQSHDRLMSVSSRNDGMCSGMDQMSTMMVCNQL